MDNWLALNLELKRLIERLDVCYDDDEYNSLQEQIDKVRAEIKALG